MGTSAGPSLQGIGRGGDSNLVLEMDAHDAKSYPGEPTTNLIPYYSSRNPALVASVFIAEPLWTSKADSTDVIAPDGSSTTTKAVTGTTGASYLYRYIDNNMGVTMASSTTYTLSVWAKTTSTASTTVSLAFQDRGNGAYNTSVKTITTEWQRFSLTITTGSGATSSTLVGWVSPTHSRTFYFWGWQVEQKAYATPYVVSQLLDPSAQGPSARPASVNLMIHGNVGPDTVAGSNNPNVLSEAISKFETAVGWTVGQDWSINSGTEVAEITSWTQASFLQRAASPAEVIEGGRYVIKGDVTTSNAGTLYARVGNSSYAVLPTGTGSTVEVVCGNTATETVLFYSGGWEGTIDNVSVAPLAVMKDSSPSKHAITTVNDADHSNAQSKFSGGSIYFDGSDSLSMPDSADWNIGSADFTMDAWAYFDGFAVTLHNQSTVNATSNSAFIIWVGSAPNTAGIYLSDITGWDYYNVNSTSLSTGQWYHLAAVRHGDSLRMYVDGVSTSATSLPSAWTVGDSSRVLQIGEQDGNNYMNGYLDEVRFVKGTALWTSNFTPPTRRNLSAPVVDRSGNDNGGNFNTTDMTDVVTYRVGEVIRPIDSAVWDFDGSDDYVNLGSGSSLKPTTAITISVWVNPDSSQNTYADIGGGHQNNQGYVIQQNATSTNQYYFAYRNTSPAWVSTGTTTLTADTWQHFVITCEFGGTTKHYLNGVETISTSLSGAILYISSEDMFIGHGFSTARCFNGQIGNVQVYKTTLTPQQVKENFNQQRNRFKI